MLSKHTRSGRLYVLIHIGSRKHIPAATMEWDGMGTVLFENYSIIFLHISIFWADRWVDLVDGFLLYLSSPEAMIYYKQRLAKSAFEFINTTG